MRFIQLVMELKKEGNEPLAIAGCMLAGAVQIYQLDENDNRRYGVELVEAFPKTIAAQDLNYGSTNQQQKLSVSFSYRYWKNLQDEADLPKFRGGSPIQNQIIRGIDKTKTTAFLMNE